VDTPESSASALKLLLTKKDVATALSVSLRTVDNLISRKELPVKRIGRRVLVPFSALVRFASSTRTQKTRPSSVVSKPGEQYQLLHCLQICNGWTLPPVWRPILTRKQGTPYPAVSFVSISAGIASHTLALLLSGVDQF
jgi:excisionase family DNA binding protein